MYTSVDETDAGALISGSPAQTEAWLTVKLAADKKQADLSLLLKARADPNAVVRVEWRDFETSPLLEAAVSGHTRVAKMLLAAGADVDLSLIHI